jgi:3',5'-cyclic AMP phosphodiesterase CpdA
VPRLLAISDLHVAHPENREIVTRLVPVSDGDWLIVAGDVAATVAGIEWALTELSQRFARVIWTPGNHDLWTMPKDPVQLRGRARYEHLVALCRRLGVLTPEDPYAEFPGEAGPVAVAPLFLLYDYTFWPAGTATQQEALAVARAARVVCTDEFLLHPDPYPSREAWCQARVAYTEQRLAALGGAPAVLASHWPLTRHPTQVLRYPEFALWCGTEQTADWHVRFRAAAAVYGHLHLPRTTVLDGVRFEEVSVGYPREWHQQRHRPPGWLREILPGPSGP